ncbi:MAG: hypothetical protein LBR85_06980 [Oscillospiraceae bacterium]|jgi:hypothetical protein|nr:hypothetical protein [Oscillospiraceae bacterium]
MKEGMEDVAKNILGEERARKVDLKAVAALMDSPEGKTLLKQLSGSGGDALKKAAACAVEGDTGAATRMMASLLTSKEGQALVKQVTAVGKKTGN